MPSRLFPPAKHNCSREAETEQQIKLDGAVEAGAGLQIQLDRNPARRARKSIFHPPLRSRPAGSIGLCGGSYCRRPSSCCGSMADSKSGRPADANHGIRLQQRGYVATRIVKRHYSREATAGMGGRIANPVERGNQIASLVGQAKAVLQIRLR